ncbi:jg2883 [Pararge aegeria aegeria]|uniref:Jg2883 protein n=1 Tax=Pararge aegeria aegeria TaxID=348720 RepID=A0A8S4SDE6_9NEOP|nr:jg2883 [Pararge aegeria aegeria]
MPHYYCLWKRATSGHEEAEDQCKKNLEHQDIREKYEQKGEVGTLEEGRNYRSAIREGPKKVWLRGGLTLREAIKLMEIVYATGRLRAIDLVEINPALGNDSDRKRTIDAGLCILKAGLGFSRRGTTPRGVVDLPVQTYHEYK